MNVTLSILHSAILVMTPLLLASLGGLFTELTGMLNIALEGLLLIGSFFGIIGTYYTGSLLQGIAWGILSAMALSAVMASITLYLKSNVFITGLAVNLFASGFTVVLSFKLFQNKGVVVFDTIPSLPVFSIPFLKDIPILNALFSGYSAFVYVSWFLLFLGYIILKKTVFGFRLRATGLNSQALSSLGIRANHYRFLAFLISGFTCGLGGSLLTLNLGAFVPNITAGKGWIALVVIFLGNKSPLGLLIASFLFGLSEAFGNYAQGAFNLPSDFILAIPYLFTLIAMLFYSAFEKRKMG
ncbi:ABC transporter permease [uncultured Sphaerochaeta sp.]|uniref:ABC transporter permease n=1 Tax=uncultured Sphaerochaeta sp. TaxID=886478 RepID=UPI002A0A8B9D|nr:ABC transporter permease [uncultured Sphaerochaeta sp.]